MRFTTRLTLAAGLLGLAVLLLCGCPAGNGTGTGTGSGSRTAGTSGSAIMANITDPGISFTKVTVGLPARTLDYVGSEPAALAGAPAGQKVFFGIEDEDKIRLYSRDLATGQRKYLTELADFAKGSLVTDAAGRQLVYSRLRKTNMYIDDPFINFPENLSLTYRFDTGTGETTELFDFRDNPWRAYRSDNHIPFISADGSTVYVLAYNIDWLALDSQLKEWLAIEGNYRESYDELTADERTETEFTLRQLFTTHQVEPLITELGVVSPETGKITIEEHDAIVALERETGIPEAALLIWQDGETRLLPLKLDPDRQFAYHYILAADSNTVLMVAPEQFADQAEPQPIYKVDLETGELAECANYLGAPSNYQLDATGRNLVLVYNPVNAEAREIMTETHVQIIPLDGSESTDLVLENDYMGLIGTTSDYSTLVGQDREDYDLYIVDTASGERQVLKKLLAGVESIFIEDSGQHVVYSDSGVLFQLDVPADPPADPAWVADEYFTAYRGNIVEFLTTIGFDPQDDLTYEWEDREGLGEHEIAVEIRTPSAPDKLALLRYQVDQEQVISLWFPLGYPFPISEELTGSELDYYAAEDIVEEVLNRLGWLNPETRSVYQPGPNPLYDGRTNSFIVVFRDGYWLGEGDDAQWVYNAEATMRINAADGSIAEMTLSDLDRVQNQQISLPLDKAEFLIRNREDMPIPESANVRFDLDNYRLIIHQRRLEHWSESGYEIALVDRICYEIDTYIMPEDALILTTRIDATSGDILGELDFMPSNIDY